MLVHSDVRSAHEAFPAATQSQLEEMRLLGIVDKDGRTLERSFKETPGPTRVERTPIEAPEVLNEAYAYAKPSSFTRGLRVKLGTVDLLLISGTASIDEEGNSVYIGDFRAQLWRTYRNITTLLESEGASWQDIIRTTCYLRDIERDYKDFNEVRTQFLGWLGLDPLPASTGIQARLCREELLVEIEAMAALPAGR